MIIINLKRTEIAIMYFVSFLFTTTSIPRSGRMLVIQLRIQRVPESLPPGIKIEVGHSPPSSTGTENMRVCISTPPSRPHGEMLRAPTPLFIAQCKRYAF
jgi:hypothetical protein